MHQATCACQPDHDPVGTSVRGFGPKGRGKGIGTRSALAARGHEVVYALFAAAQQGPKTVS